jgi:hypothetical protein
MGGAHLFVSFREMIIPPGSVSRFGDIRKHKMPGCFQTPKRKVISPLNPPENNPILSEMKILSRKYDLSGGRKPDAGFEGASGKGVGIGLPCRSYI